MSDQKSDPEPGFLRYYDRNGQRITEQQMLDLLSLPGYRRVASQDLPHGRRCSTIWLPFDHAYGEEFGPVIFETMVFGSGGKPLYCERYSTEEEAVEGHRQAVEKYSRAVPARP